MEYEVKLTDYAIGQVGDTMEYISKILLSPESAHSWANRLQKELSSLAIFPNRSPLVTQQPWNEMGIRRMTVGNFLVYYFTEEVEKTVWVIAVPYGRRDQLSVLREAPIP